MGRSQNPSTKDYKEQELALWNVAFAQGFILSIGQGRTDDEAALVAVEVAHRTVEAHRALMRRYGKDG